jgi:hypothetical protein
MVAKASAAMMMGSVFIPAPLLLQLDFEIVNLVLQRQAIKTIAAAWTGPS